MDLMPWLDCLALTSKYRASIFCMPENYLEDLLRCTFLMSRKGPENVHT